MCIKKKKISFIFEFNFARPKKCPGTGGDYRGEFGAFESVTFVLPSSNFLRPEPDFVKPMRLNCATRIRRRASYEP
jgi:hypothetical protein